MRAPLTTQGAQRLRAELEELKSVKRPAVINAIAEARAHGDLKENAEYHAAREQQGFIEGRIKQLEGELSHAQVIDISTLNAGSRVVFGATVVLADAESGEERRLPDRRRPRSRHQAGPDRDLLAGRARADRQARGRHHHHRGAGRHPRVRDRRRPLRRLRMAQATLLLPAASAFWRTTAGGLPPRSRLVVAIAMYRLRRAARRSCCATFELLPNHWPLAALTRQADVGDAAGAACWLRADPAHVRPDINGARLLAIGESLALTSQDSAAFLPALKPLFGDAGFPIDAPTPSRWYLRLPREARLPVFTEPDDALGADLFDHLAEGDQGRRWRTLLSEAQVLLHNHPMERAARGAGQAAGEFAVVLGRGHLAGLRAFDPCRGMFER